MDKKIARIYRWLDRCLKACSAGSWNSALLDMECAKAELEEVRTELWKRAESSVEKSGARKAGLALRISCLSFALLLALAAPLAVQSAGPGSSAPVGEISTMHSPEGTLEWVTGDEKALLAALRKSLSEGNRAWLSEIRDIPSDRHPRSSEENVGDEEGDLGENRVHSLKSDVAALPSGEVRSLSSSLRNGGKAAFKPPARTSRPQEKPLEDGKAESTEKRSVSDSRELDSIITLVQIGQKALRERESPIRFQ